MRPALLAASPNPTSRAARSPACTAIANGRWAPVGLSLLATTAWLWTSPALACKCMPQGVPQSFEQAVAVFEGHVVEIHEPKAEGKGAAPLRRVRMRVARAWKGMESEQTEVSTPADSAACGYPFALQQSYLVYAFAEEGQLRVSACSRSRPMAEAGEDLRLLGMGATPVDPKTPAAADEKAQLKARPARARGGCASCAVAPESPSDAGGWILCVIGVAAGVRLRHRKRRRPAAPPGYLPPKI